MGRGKIMASNRYVLENDTAPQASGRFILEPETNIDGGKTQDQPWSDVASGAVINAIPSAIQFGKNMVQPIVHPIDTASNLLKLGQGAVVNAVPDSVLNLVNRINPSGAQRRTDVAGLASQVGNQYKTDYGSVEGLKNKLASDPVGALSDASVVLSGGAGLASKIPPLNKGISIATKLPIIKNPIKVNIPSVSSVLNSSSTITNPINIVSKPVEMAGNLAANLVSAFGTHTGSMPIKQAFKSGMEGGESAKNFVQNMRSEADPTAVLETAKANIADMGKAKSAEYKAGMQQVSGDKSVLSMDGIKEALANAKSSISFAGQPKNERAASVLSDIGEEVNNWSKLDPAVYHTPEGLDALKQRIGGIIEQQPFEQKTARMAANNVYHAIKGEIVKQAPVYAQTMQKYSDAMDEITEIERTLSLGKKASVDTAMRKLQSLTRNNVNTNYGNRLNLAKTLEEKGGRQLMPALAGQALNNFAPRGLGGTVAGGTALGGYAMGGAPAAMALLAAQSPRLIGETTYKLGQAARIPNTVVKGVRRLGADPAMTANLLAQGGLLGRSR
jgi:hypothetical protein